MCFACSKKNVWWHDVEREILRMLNIHIQPILIEKLVRN